MDFVHRFQRYAKLLYSGRKIEQELVIETCVKTFFFFQILGKVLSSPPDLIEALHLLLCCADLLFVHMPNAERRVSIAEIAGKNSINPPKCSRILFCTIIKHFIQS